MLTLRIRIALILLAILAGRLALGQGADLSVARGNFGDFNGDGRDDVLLRHADGRWTYYPMNGRQIVVEGRGSVGLTKDRRWLFAGIGDFNGDGNDDMLLRHVNGRWRYFIMDGRAVLGNGAIDGMTTNMDWNFAGVGDLNGDGTDDVVLRHNNGRWFYYPIRDGAVLGGDGDAGAGDLNLTQDAAWRYAGLGDFNGDGRDDLLLRHEDGRWLYAPMDGRVRGAGYGSANITRDIAWNLAGIGDLNGDGNDDVLLRHWTGGWSYYPMNGRQRLADHGAAALSEDFVWSMAGIGDLDGDGKDDVLLRHEDGRWSYQTMDGRQRLGGGSAKLTRNLAWRGIFQRSTVAGRPTSWAEGVFADHGEFRARCAVPRFGVDAEGRTFPDVPGAVEDENNWLRSWSNHTYLWYDEILDIEPACCDTPTYFQVMRTFARTPSGAFKDRFHYSEDTATYLARIRSGVSAGYGTRFAILARHPPRLLRIAYTEPNSPAADVDLRRGATILTIDGVDVARGAAGPLNAGLFPRLGETHTFTVMDVGATEARNLEMTAQAVRAEPVQRVRILETESGRVGYFLFNSHNTLAERGLIDAVRKLRDAQVSDLVLDLRYNGGGYLAIANQMAYMIAGLKAQGRVFSQTQFNRKHREYNPVNGALLTPSYFLPATTGWFSEPRGQPFPFLNLDRVFVLAGPRTCSASEAIINGLRGIDVEVVLIGETTCGKPYGFYTADNCGTSYSSAQFRGVNAAGFGDYTDGFSPANLPQVKGVAVPGCAIADDFDNPLGDAMEGRLRAALGYRRDGACPAATARAAGAGGFERFEEAVVDPSASAWGESIAIDPVQQPMRW